MLLASGKANVKICMLVSEERKFLTPDLPGLRLVCDMHTSE